ncbi:MAG: chromosomal replication initiator protein DnaA, partial [Myxococcota bacterium]|nr:chromosomal replication initiator protein DnaA [Myxococcota bacterium]
LGTDREVHFEVVPQVRPTPASAAPTDTATRTTDRQTGTARGVDSRKTFEDFVVGSCNQFSHAAALAVADSPGDPHYNPLFIYGDTGLGKSHLMHSIGNRIHEHDPEANLIYVTAEQFTNEMIQALRYNRMPEFRDHYRKRPTILLIDDIQFIGGKERTQEELFHTFEWLRQQGRQIVFTADKLPREIRGLEPRLRTRCEGGMLADMQPPDLETLTAILQVKAEELGLSIPNDLAQYIIKRVPGDIRKLEGVVNRLRALTRLHHQPLTFEFGRKHLSSVLLDEPEAPTMESIVKTVADFYSVKISDLKGKRRTKQLVRPRHVAIFLIRKHTQHSFPDIARFFNRDNATVQHACNKIKSHQPKDADLRNAIDILERLIRH